MTSIGPRSIDEAANWLRKRFDPEAASGARVSYRFELTGPAGGTFGVSVDAGRLDVDPVPPHDPDVHLRLPASDFFAVLAGRENADMLFMAGRLEVEGDHALALELRRFFRAPA